MTCRTAWSRRGAISSDCSRMCVRSSTRSPRRFSSSPSRRRLLAPAPVVEPVIAVPEVPVVDEVEHEAALAAIAPLFEREDSLSVESTVDIPAPVFPPAPVPAPGPAPVSRARADACGSRSRDGTSWQGRRRDGACRHCSVDPRGRRLVAFQLPRGRGEPCSAARRGSAGAARHAVMGGRPDAHAVGQPRRAGAGDTQPVVAGDRNASRGVGGILD